MRDRDGALHVKLPAVAGTALLRAALRLGNLEALS